MTFFPQAFKPGIALLILIACAAPGCNNSTGHSTAPQFRFSGKHPIKAVCTTGMVADLVRNVGGPHVEVVQLMGEGIDPHLYKASTADIDKLSAADVIFYSGLHLEGKMGDVFVRMAPQEADLRGHRGRARRPRPGGRRRTLRSAPLVRRLALEPVRGSGREGAGRNTIPRTRRSISRTRSNTATGWRSCTRSASRRPPLFRRSAACW